ncbi:MAG: ATP-binding cassette domain-containing protein, partial [Desulfobulbaceae bacterium]|nr:ATP-binding cassette domain-containing protein [Desulfobulbaceae bacterium]
RRKDEELSVQAEHLKKFDKKLSQEETWIRQGIKARRTRNEGRVRELKAMREERRAVRERIGTARMHLQEAEKSGRLVVRAENISYSYDTMPVIGDYTTTVMRGDKVGIIGPNGCGKTTLINLLLGKLTPDSGSIRLGANLEIAYFDQLRAQLDEEATVAENVGDGKEILTINGCNKHVIGYLKDFLFAPDRARSPVKILSGGERNRLLLAKLFTQPANLLVLDEPTNDLDMETLELLEELLLNFKGTVLLVSHDRAFLNNVVTGTMVFEGNGLIGEYAGGYDDWLVQRKIPEAELKESKCKKKETQRVKKEKVRKLTFKEKKELEELPKKIEILEEEQQRLYGTLADPTFYQESGREAAEMTQRLEVLERELETAYQRWEELEAVPDK